MTAAKAASPICLTRICTSSEKPTPSEVLAELKNGTKPSWLVELVAVGTSGELAKSQSATSAAQTGHSLPSHIPVFYAPSRSQGGSYHADCTRFPGPRLSRRWQRKSIPRARKSLPWPRKSLPWPRKSLPRPRKSLPRPRKSLPRARKSFPRARKSFPWPLKSLPGLRKSFPCTRKSFSRTRKSLSWARKSFPGTRKSFPGLGSHFPAPRRLFPWPRKLLRPTVICPPSVRLSAGAGAA
jgi:hypothetical protein